jgi:phosphoribosyl-ATP pyrophosphohydrolase/phosphoribosyl-AMP cyclohydrolase
VSCFGNADAGFLSQLDRTIEVRAKTALTESEPSYTQRLIANRNMRLKKIGEEAAEFVIACSDEDKEAATAEAADLIYHMLVALRALDVGLVDVQNVLASRHSNAAFKPSFP